MRHIPEGFHADRFLRLIAMREAQEDVPAPLASTPLARDLLAKSRTARRPDVAPINLLALRRHI